jgi:hypothetical protein
MMVEGPDLSDSTITHGGQPPRRTDAKGQFAVLVNAVLDAPIGEWQSMDIGEVNRSNAYGQLARDLATRSYEITVRENKIWIRKLQ